MTMGRLDPTGTAGHAMAIFPGAANGSEAEKGLQALQTQARILEAIARGAPLDTVLTAACGLIEALDVGALTGVQILSADARHFTRAVGAAAPGAWLQQLRDWPLSSAHHRCPCTTAVLQNEVAMALDVDADTRWSDDWRTLLLSHGMHACLSYPICAPTGAPLGSLFVAYTEPVTDVARWNLDLIGMGARLAELALERERAHQELRQLHERLDSPAQGYNPERTNIWNLSNDLMAVAGFDGVLRSINPAWTRVLDLDEPTLLAQPFRNLVHHDDLPRANEAIEQLRRGEVLRRLDERLRGADGSYHWFSWTAVAHGDVFYAIGREVTDQEPVQGEHGFSADHSQQTIDHRQRVEATLTQMQRLEALGQLTAGVAHDFNNLLTVVLGNLDYVERRAEQWATHSTQFARRLSFARVAAEHGSKLIAQLLTFSRRQQLEPKVIDLNEVVGDMRYLLQSTLSSSISLELVPHEHLWHALVDPTQLELVILNLTINSRDAMPTGGRLRVATANLSMSSADARLDLPAGDYVVVSISDNGTGMSDQVLNRAFEPFFTTKDIGHGSGLGLAQVYGFAKQSGGGVRIDTRVGRGTTVHVFLPGVPKAIADGQTQAHRSAVSLEGKHVLLVDDDPGVRQVTHAMLLELGCSVVTANGADAALNILQTGAAIDLLLADFAMPGMNGAELARSAADRYPHLPVIIVTGYADVDALRDIPPTAILRKPFRREQLADKIVAHLRTS